MPNKYLATLDNGQELWLHDPAPNAALILENGPHLFVDNFLIESTGLQRIVSAPIRYRATPILSQADGVRNFSANVIRDAVSGQYRIWYQTWDGVDSDTGYSIVRNATRTSNDGVNWGPQTIVTSLTPAIYRVVDRGTGVQRYVTIVHGQELPPRWTGLAYTSPDGLVWSSANYNPVAPTRYGEIWSLGQDGHLLHRYNRIPWTDENGFHGNSIHDQQFVRTIYQASLGVDGLHYTPSTPAFIPGSQDSGETQFYSVSNVLMRGGLRLCVLHILRDDLTASGVPAGAFGMGYSVLAWSRDGVIWDRHKGADPHFFDPSPDPLAWDHAHAWITSIVPVGNEIYCYYGGYQHGHKVYTDRNIGLVKMTLDRYVARRAGSTPLVLRTKPITFTADVLKINSKGKVQIQFVDAANVPISGFAYSDIPTVMADGAATRVVTNVPLSELSGITVKIEFKLTNADLYGFYLS